MNLRLRTFLIVAIAILLFTGALYGASVFFNQRPRSSD